MPTPIVVTFLYLDERDALATGRESFDSETEAAAFRLAAFLSGALTVEMEYQDDRQNRTS